MNIKKITEGGVHLQGIRTLGSIHVRQLVDIMQFEIDQKFRDFQPFCHYTVSPSIT